MEVDIGGEIRRAKPPRLPNLRRFLHLAEVVVTDSSGVQVERPRPDGRRWSYGESHRHGHGAIPDQALHLVDLVDLTNDLVAGIRNRFVAGKMPEQRGPYAGRDIVSLLFVGEVEGHVGR